MSNVIKLTNVSEIYRILSVVNGKKTWKDFWALKDISFTVKKGETVGIIGENGVGKTTILKIIAGILTPDKGDVIVSGSVAGLLEIGAGFENELTGYDNIFFNTCMLGMDKSQTNACLQSIIEFADIGDFLYVPVKCYSQGMFVRLAFAIAVHVNPDILLIDDTFSVGDEEFQQKSMDKIMEFKQQGKTIVFVSHNMDIVSNFAQRVILLQGGRIVQDDVAAKTVLYYRETVGKKEGIAILEKDGPLRVIFNNGRILFNWNGRMLTKRDGVCFSFNYNGRIYYSTQLVWHLERQNGNTYVFLGEKKSWNICLKVLIELTDEGALNIEGDVQCNEQEESQLALKFSFMTGTEYDQWVAMKARGDFEAIAFDDIKPVNCFQIEEAYSHIGLRASNDKEHLPFLFFRTNIPTRGLISNSEYQRQSRIIQFSNLNSENRLATTIFFGMDALKLCAKFRREKKNLDKYKKEAATLKNGRIKVFVDNNRVRLFWDDKEITSAAGIYGDIIVAGKTHSNCYAEWKELSRIDDRIVWTIKHHDIDLTERWEVQGENTGKIKITVGLMFCDVRNIELYLLNCMLVPGYKSWETSQDSGMFPDIFYELSCFDILQKNIVNGLVSVMEEREENLPNLVFEGVNSVTRLLNSQKKDQSRLIQVFNHIEQIKENSSEKELFQQIGMTISCNPNGRSADLDLSSQKIDLVSLGRFDVKLSGRVMHLYYDGELLTKGLGLYAALYRGGRWHSTSMANWRVKKKQDNLFVLEAQYLDLPVILTWHLLFKENHLFVEVTVCVEEECIVDGIQINLMLSEEYKRWFAKDKSDIGYFPKFKEDISHDWDCLFSSVANGNPIGISCHNENGHNENSVLFLGKLFDANSCLGILNSDLYYSGRVLQTISRDKKVLLPTQQKFFSGEIKVENTK